ncbi:MAG: hypothetical protein ACRDSZ_07045 [Pseudonocardiaceae bacterium]
MHVADHPEPVDAVSAWARVADEPLRPGGADAGRAHSLYLFVMSLPATFSQDFADDLYRP